LRKRWVGLAKPFFSRPDTLFQIFTGFERQLESVFEFQAAEPAEYPIIDLSTFVVEFQTVLTAKLEGVLVKPI
jgi:hypothetical protein